MSATSTWHAHKIYFVVDTQTWHFEATGQKVSDNPDIKCGHCQLEPTPEGHDGCLGTLPGVMNACCGHGDDSAAYVQFPDGSCVRGIDAAKALLGLQAGGGA